MGTDIYLRAEKLMDSKWIPINCPLSEPRDYDLFAVLAGVGPRALQWDMVAAPRGLPADASNEVRQEVESWGNEARCVSYVTIQELELYVQERRESIPLPRGAVAAQEFLSSVHAALRECLVDIAWSRLVFWFDNAVTSNAPE